MQSPIQRASAVAHALSAAWLVALGPFASACGEDESIGRAAPDPSSVAPVCAPDQCEIGGGCRDHLAPNPDNPCEQCNVTVARTRYTAFDAGACDDGSACTRDDVCQAGRCTGTPSFCDDGNPCTRDGCDAATGECTYEPDEAQCGANPCGAEDEDPPLTDDGAGDAGDAGEAAIPRDATSRCDDGNPCTEDRCEPFVGCVHTPVVSDEPIACDDGNACTLGDLCVEGACEGQVATDCDDGDHCTIDVCDPTSPEGCRHESIANLCADDNPCTDDACDPERGCVYTFNDDPCDDRSACTTGDTCQAGACIGRHVDPNDGNPCTDDACDPASGVVNIPNRLPCTDLNACTVGDTCADGLCVPGATPLPCDDANACTDDGCEPASGCVFTEHTRACDDASLCSDNDRCRAGECVGQVVDCDDANTCTADSCAPATGCNNELIVSNPCRPTITVTYPPRGATLTEGSSQTITVTGTVGSGAGPITSLRINNVNTSVNADGSFARTITPSHGSNMLVIVATDSFGSQRRVVQSFLWSRGYRHPTTAKNGIVADGVGVWLDKIAIDDGTRGSPPNDLASIMQIALRSFDIGAAIPRPAANNLNAGGIVGTYDIYVNNFTHSPATVQLWPRSGGIHMRGRLTNGRADIRASKQCSAGVFSCWGPGTITGTLTFSAIQIDVDLDFSVSSNDIRVTVRSSNVAISGVNIDIDGAFGWLIEFVIGFFEDDLVDTIEDRFNDQLAPIIGPLVRDGLRELAFQMRLNVPKVQGGGSIPIDLVTDWRSVSCSSEGCRIVLRGGVYTPTKVTPYTNSGVPNRDACGDGTQSLAVPGNKILELSLPDDTLNQLLFALWRGGLLEFPVPSSWLSGVNLSEYGISNLSMTVSGMLAPTATDCGGTGFDAHVGDVKISASMRLFGQNVNVVIWASVRAGMQLYLDGRKIGIRLTSIERVETEVNVVQSQLIGLEPVIADLIEDEVIANLVDQLGDGDLGSFPLPDIDLSGAISGLPAGTGITIVPENIIRSGGNTIAGGRLD